MFGAYLPDFLFNMLKDSPRLILLMAMLLRQVRFTEGESPRGQKLQPGELVTSREYLAELTGQHPSTVRRDLNKLQDLRLITLSTNNRRKGGTVVKINSFPSRYRASEQWTGQYQPRKDNGKHRGEITSESKPRTIGGPIDNSAEQYCEQFDIKTNIEKNGCQTIEEPPLRTTNRTHTVPSGRSTSTSDDDDHVWAGETLTPRQLASIADARQKLLRTIPLGDDPKQRAEDGELAIKVCILAHTRYCEGWLWDAVEGTVRCAKNPWGYLHTCLRNSASEQGRNFGKDLATTHIPASLLQVNGNH